MTTEKVIDILNGIKYGTARLMPNMPEDGEKAIDIAIKAVEQSEPHWIPVTEGLPEESGLYQVTDMQGNVVRYVFNVSEGSEEYWRRCVKAWMPLPEPYKGVTE